MNKMYSKIHFECFFGHYGSQWSPKLFGYQQSSNDLLLFSEEQFSFLGELGVLKVIYIVVIKG